MYRRDIAVCTRALSSDAYFRLWHDYYGKQVGFNNLFVVSISPDKNEFSEYELGGLLSLSSYPYDERQKARMFQNMLGFLLQTHKYVLICDVDEIIVADPAVYENLPDFVTRDARPYFTCLGFNVVQYRDEAPLDLDKPVLVEQRSYARFVSPMCKTCFTSVDFKVPATFHYVPLYPSFGSLFLFHMKHADTVIEADWGSATRSIEFADPTRSEHHNRTDQRIAHFKRSHDKLDFYSGDDHFPLNDTVGNMLSTARFDPGMGIYRWDRYDEPLVAKIPTKFKSAF